VLASSRPSGFTDATVLPSRFAISAIVRSEKRKGSGSRPDPYTRVLGPDGGVELLGEAVPIASATIAMTPHDLVTTRPSSGPTRISFIG
jgi:hypothetical protein